MAEKERVWYDLEEYVLSEDESHGWEDGDLRSRVGVLRRLKPGQYIVVATIIDDMKNTGPFQDYIEELRGYGLDVGKGDAEYGHRMPIPERGAKKRELIVFRRR